MRKDERSSRRADDRWSALDDHQSWTSSNRRGRYSGSRAYRDEHDTRGDYDGDSRRHGGGGSHRGGAKKQFGSFIVQNALEMAHKLQRQKEQVEKQLRSQKLDQNTQLDKLLKLQGYYREQFNYYRDSYVFSRDDEFLHKQHERRTAKEKQRREERHKDRQRRSSSRRHERHSSTDSRGSESDCASDFDIDKELFSIDGYIGRPEAMVSNMYRSLSSNKMRAMLPEVLKDVSLDELRKLCVKQLENMSKRRILAVIDGKDLGTLSSSSEEEQEPEPVAKRESSEESERERHTGASSDKRLSSKQKKHKTKKRRKEKDRSESGEEKTSPKKRGKHSSSRSPRRARAAKKNLAPMSCAQLEQEENGSDQNDADNPNEDGSSTAPRKTHHKRQYRKVMLHDPAKSATATSTAESTATQDKVGHDTSKEEAFHGIELDSTDCLESLDGPTSKRKSSTTADEENAESGAESECEIIINNDFTGAKWRPISLSNADRRKTADAVDNNDKASAVDNNDKAPAGEATKPNSNGIPTTNDSTEKTTDVSPSGASSPRSNEKAGLSPSAAEDLDRIEMEARRKLAVERNKKLHEKVDTDLQSMIKKRIDKREKRKAGLNSKAKAASKKRRRKRSKSQSSSAGSDSEPSPAAAPAPAKRPQQAVVAHSHNVDAAAAMDILELELRARAIKAMLTKMDN